MEEINTEFKRIGLSQNEIQVYAEVLKHFPITGYDTSKRSNIPRTKIYELLGKLIEKGAVFTGTLVPLTLDNLISRLVNEW
ncbi:helix-turn-helix domain-containing protein [Metabacillus halosaccharovorans]|uniref:helix-turn-helix domain-containing protein n=1 Tax=Metabacillus halosaccharovorans TaxID=930124 RepID=UPI001C1FA395|nr:helix-turn-helix domain-containing protein [Metabacillus halosaccharovorans]